MDSFPCSVEIDAKEILRGKNLKATPQRLAVLHVLHSSRRYMETEEIHEKVREILPRTGLATIYRTLESFADIGLIVRIHFKDGCHHYTITPEGHGHYMICTECKKTMEFEECPFDKFVEKVAKRTGFSINRHFVQLYGQCGKCRQS